MGFAAHDELLLGVEDVVGGNRPRAVTPGFAAEASFCAQRVHQPWLAPGLSPYGIQRLGGEHLPRLLGVLGEQRAHFGLREVAEAQGSGLDVERAATGDHGTLRGGLDPIVADVSHPAEHDAVREALGPTEVLPVYRGACSTKYRMSRTRSSTTPRSSRSSGGMQ